MTKFKVARVACRLWIAAFLPATALGQTTYESIEASGTSPTLALVGDGVVADRIPGCDALAEGGDWIDDQDRTYRRVVPRNCYLSRDNPPLFWWAPHLNKTVDARYTLAVTRTESPTATYTYATANPYFRVPGTYAPGIYRWQVSVATKSGVAFSRVRTFRIDANESRSVVAPDGVAALSTIVAQQRRPRLFPPPAEQGPIKKAALDGARRPEYELFLQSANQYAGEVADSNGGYGMYTNRNNSGQEGDAITVLGIAWRMTGHDKYLTVGKQRLLALADRTPGSLWDPGKGSCTYTTAHDFANVYLGLARGFDLFHADLTPDQRSAVLSAALARIRACANAFAPVDVFSRSFPYRSHEANHLHYLIQALALLAGESGEADRLFTAYWDLYCSIMPVWGMQDGSDGNGTGYGWANFLELPVALLTLRNVLGTDYFSNRSFVRNAGRRLAYFGPPVPLLAYLSQPPYAGVISPLTAGPINVFGDGGSDVVGGYWYPANVDRTFRIYSTLVDDPLHRWYRQQGIVRYPFVGKADYQPVYRALYLLAPPEAATNADFPAGTPGSQAFPEAGQVAMHDDLANPLRTSLYFLSSPFGSHNHSEAEQNSFVLHMAGEPVLINAGYYDSYGSAHHGGYTRHTRAKNALTYDGGRGQAETVAGGIVNSMDFSGRLVNVRTSGALHVATGDAARAYLVCNGAAMNPGCSVKPYLAPITKAIRSVASLHDPAVKAYFVYDRIEGAAPHVWEWNLHSFKPFEVVSSGRPFTIKAYGPSGKQSVCVDLYGPAVEFSQTDAFPIPPAATPGRANRYPNQWHARFRSKQASTGATFLAVLREHCAARPFVVEIDQPAGTARAVINPGDAPDARRWVTFAGERVFTYGGLE